VNAQSPHWQFSADRLISVFGAGNAPSAIADDAPELRGACTNPSPWETSFRDGVIKIPCGSCDNCAKRFRNHKYVRFNNVIRDHSNAELSDWFFGTLTYDDPSLGASEARILRRRITNWPDKYCPALHRLFAKHGVNPRSGLKTLAGVESFILGRSSIGVPYPDVKAAAELRLEGALTIREFRSLKRRVGSGGERRFCQDLAARFYLAHIHPEQDGFHLREFYPDFQSFMMRLRKRLNDVRKKSGLGPAKLEFLMSTEAGKLSTKRTHHHFILLGGRALFSGIINVRVNPTKCPLADVISEFWPHGFTSVRYDDASARAEYTCKYVMKASRARHEDGASIDRYYGNYHQTSQSFGLSSFRSYGRDLGKEHLRYTKRCFPTSTFAYIGRGFYRHLVSGAVVASHVVGPALVRIDGYGRGVDKRARAEMNIGFRQVCGGLSFYTDGEFCRVYDALPDASKWKPDIGFSFVAARNELEAVCSGSNVRYDDYVLMTQALEPIPYVEGSSPP